jgi:transposase-like protein
MSTNEEKPITESIQVDEQETSAITLLPTKMQRFIHLYMTGQYTLSKLAQLLEVHPNTLGNWLKRADVRAIIEEMQETTHDVVATQLKALTLSAVGRLGELTKSPIDGVALQAVKDILDRAGHKPKQEMKIEKTITTYEERLNKLIDESLVKYEVKEDESK